MTKKNVWTDYMDILAMREYEEMMVERYGTVSVKEETDDKKEDKEKVTTKEEA